MDQKELQEIVEKHKKWLNDVEGGERADLSGASLSDANLSCAILSEANLSCADLRGASLSGADLSCADLRGASLSGADLRGASLSGADLSGADLSCASLSDANLSWANLRGADLSGANLSCADLRGASLRGADLRGADLSGASFSGAILSGAILSGARGILSAIDFIARNFEKSAEGYIAYKTFGETFNIPKIWKIEAGQVISENVNFCRTDDCGCGINVAPFAWVKSKHPKSKIWKVLIRWAWLAGVCVPYNSDGKIRCERVELVEEVKESQT